jgi:hypothetical protein
MTDPIWAVPDVGGVQGTVRDETFTEVAAAPDTDGAGVTRAPLPPADLTRTPVAADPDNS